VKLLIIKDEKILLLLLLLLALATPLATPLQTNAL
jgi:hypothetical protein